MEGVVATRLAGARAVVTGASSGIGRAIAEAFAGAGADVLATYRGNEDGARELAERTGAQVAQADLATREACEALVAEARERLGGLDVWVNNAGADVLTGEAAGWEWERKLDLLLAVDLKGTIACSFAAGAVDARAARGRRDPEHELGPRHDRDGGREPASCSAPSRAACSRSARASPARSRRSVRVNVLCPGWIETAFAQGADREFHRRGRASPLRCGAGAGPRTSPPPPSGSPPPTPRSSPGRAVNINGGVVMAESEKRCFAAGCTENFGNSASDHMSPRLPAARGSFCMTTPQE